jgi:transposase
MLARLLRLHPSTYKRLVRLSKEAERDGAYRVAKRLQAVVLNSEGQTSGELARILKAPRSKVSEWLQRYQTEGVDGLLEGYRSGRPSELTEKQQQQLEDIVDSGPGGLRSGQRHLDIAHDRLGDRGGVRRSVSPRSWAQVAPRLGIFGAASTPHSGPRRCRGAGPLAPAHLSEP